MDALRRQGRECGVDVVHEQRHMVGADVGRCRRVRSWRAARVAILDELEQSPVAQREFDDTEPGVPDADYPVDRLTVKLLVAGHFQSEQVAVEAEGAIEIGNRATRVVKAPDHGGEPSGSARPL
jgi:hypothetical protein